MIYLDYAATTPMSSSALEVYREVAENYFGNAGSLHDFGSDGDRILNKARETVAEAISGDARGVFFTGSGSEANQLAILSLLQGNKKRGNHIITCHAEHSSVRSLISLLENHGYEISYVPVNEYGRIEPEKLASLIRDDTVLASLHHAQGEIGTIQDIETIGNMLNERDVLFHSDCVQSFGNIPIDVKIARLDSITISAHKIYGPKGLGVSYINPSVSWKPVVPGTTHEKGFRPGTVDVPAVAAFMAAINEVRANMENENEHEELLRERFLGTLLNIEFDILLEGDPRHRLSNIVGLRIKGMEGQYVMIECNRLGLAISTGSACVVGSDLPAAAMKALGRDDQEAREFIRVSMGRNTTKSEIDNAVEILRNVLKKHFEMVKH